jgi:hypothetical protein
MEIAPQVVLACLTFKLDNAVLFRRPTSQSCSRRPDPSYRSLPQYGVTGGANDGAVFLRCGSVDVGIGLAAALFAFVVRGCHFLSPAPARGPRIAAARRSEESAPWSYSHMQGGTGA